MTDQKVVDTFESTIELFATINKALDLHEHYLRRLTAMVDAHAATITALQNEVEELTQTVQSHVTLPLEHTGHVE